MNKRWLKLAAVPIALSLVAAACGSDDDSGSDSDTGTETTDGGGEAGGDADFGGATVTITGPERDDPSIIAINDTLQAWAETVNLNVEYTGDADWEANINTQVEGGNPPDISFFPQPGKLADFARAGNVVALTDEVNATVDEYWADGYQLYGNVDDVQYGVPAKTDLKSLVWYQPAAFEAAGYEVPTTFDEFTALVDEMAAAGGPKPLCVGIESGQATGWTFTDWVEDMVLRQAGADVYDQWVSNEIPFDDPQIVEAMQTVVDLWTEENVFASGGSIAATAFQDNGQPLVDGQCFMHRQANFYAGLFPEGTTFADPADPDCGRRVLLPGRQRRQAGADRRHLRRCVQRRPRHDGRDELHRHGRVRGDPSEEPDRSRRWRSVRLPLGSAGPGSRRSTRRSSRASWRSSERRRSPASTASDLMPADVGAGTFWTAGTSLVNGDITAEEAAATIQASWPN